MEAWAGKIVVVFSSMEPFAARWSPRCGCAFRRQRMTTEVVKAAPTPAPKQVIDEDEDVDRFNEEVAQLDDDV